MAFRGLPRASPEQEDNRSPGRDPEGITENTVVVPEEGGGCGRHGKNEHEKNGLVSSPRSPWSDPPMGLFCDVGEQYSGSYEKHGARTPESEGRGAEGVEQHRPHLSPGGWTCPRHLDRWFSISGQDRARPALLLGECLRTSTATPAKERPQDLSRGSDAVGQPRAP